MKELLRVIVLLIKIGPKKILRLIKEAEKDFLTEIYNRRGFIDRAEKEVERSVRGDEVFSLLFIDVDGLKSINDVYGHKEGDRHLRMVTSFMKKELRKIDLIGRWGGDEFIILLPQTKRQEAVTVAERICKNRNLSFGLAVFEKDKSLEQLIFEADKEMYKKRS